MKSMNHLIKQHNIRFLKNQEHSEKRSCSCRVKDNCPLDEKFLHKFIVYQANVVTSNEFKEYFETTEGEFELRYNNHNVAFRHKKRVNDTELSKYLWKLKEGNADYNLQWSIKAYVSPYKCRTRKCDLCFTEKVIIVRSGPKKLLKKQTELVPKCRRYITIKWYYQIQKPLTAFDFMIELRTFVMQHILIKDNSDGT